MGVQNWGYRGRRSTPAALFLLLLRAHILPLSLAEEESASAERDNVGRVEIFEAQLKQVTEGGVLGVQDGLTIEAAVEGMAGPERSLILAVTSSTYLDFVLNWHASVARFGHGGRVLFMAEDREAFEFLNIRFPRQVVFSGRDSKHAKAAVKNSDFSSEYFMSIVDRKPTYVDQILKMNVSLLFNDMDMVWKEDPFPQFRGDYDIWMMEDGWAYDNEAARFVDGKPEPAIIGVPAHRVCTCFMMIRATDASKELITRWKERVASIALETGKPVHDQGHFNFVMNMSPPGTVKVGALPVQLFPSGCLYFGSDGCKWQHNRFKEAHSVDKVIVVHNNWVEGHDKKVQRFKDGGMWFVADDAGVAALDEKSASE